MPSCGSQVTICELPIRFDTYQGCTHGCSYCFARRKNGDISTVKPFESEDALRRFISGKRNQETSWCDWNIPIHWGGMSDPFQPAERLQKRSLKCLKIFADTGYPFVFSTKGAIVVEDEYLELLTKCNAVAQISMVSPKYDRLEPGAPSFEERLSMLPKLAQVTKRLIVRISPYALGLSNEVSSFMSVYKSAGVYGVEIEGMKRQNKREGLVKIGGDWCYPKENLERDFEVIKSSAKSEGLAFFVGENRLRVMGDDTCCCGVSGLSGFTPNRANLNRLIKNEPILYSSKMKETGTAKPFQQGYAQDQAKALQLCQMSYADCMTIYSNTKNALRVMGLLSD